MELRFKIDDNKINDLQDKTRIDSRAEICRQSLNMLSWAVGETEAGRKIVSIDESGNQCAWPVENILGGARW